MKAVTIATNTFREAVRDRIMYVLLLFALVVILGSKAIAWISMGQDDKMLKDLGLAGISFFTVFIAIVVGTTLIHKEMDKRTVYTILSKPVPKHQFLLGKYFGLLLTLLVIQTLMGVVFLGYIYLLGVTSDASLLKAVILIYGEVIVITAVALFFSTVTSPILGAVFTFCVYLIGHFSDGIKLLADRAESPTTKVICRALYFLLPNLEYFNAKAKATHSIPIPWENLGVAFLYGIIYSSLLLMLAMLLFRRKNL